MTTALDTGAALLRGVLEHPADDAARLIYADWLEDSGEAERAEFIHVQMELAAVRMRRTFGEPERLFDGRERLRIRAQELLAARQPNGDTNAALWFPGPWWTRDWCDAALGLCPKVAITHRNAGSRYDPGSRLTYTFGRGMVAEVAIGTADLREHAAMLFGAHPITSVVPGYGRHALPVFLPDAGWEDGSFGWHLERPHISGPSYLPRWLFELLVGDVGPGFARYPTLAGANAALSYACVRYGRLAAGLPEIP